MISVSKTVEREVQPNARMRSFVEKIPEELVAVAAYHKWRQRCNEVGTELHGRDKEDWIAAEKEIRDAVGSLNYHDFELFARRIQVSELQPTQERVSVRAYFKSQENETAEEHECWLQALAAEREIVFASVFVNFCQSRADLHVYPRT